MLNKSTYFFVPVKRKIPKICLSDNNISFRRNKISINNILDKSVLKPENNFLVSNSDKKLSEIILSEYFYEFRIPPPSIKYKTNPITYTDIYILKKNMLMIHNENNSFFVMFLIETHKDSFHLYNINSKNIVVYDSKYLINNFSTVVFNDLLYLIHINT